MSAPDTLGASWRLTRRKALPPLLTATVGAKPPNATSDALMAYVVHLVHTRYGGANHTHLSELILS